jgi:hypothetical protein
VSHPLILVRPTSKGTDVASASGLSFKEALGAPREHRPQGVTMGVSSGTEAVPAHQKLITLSSLGTRKDDSANKSTRSSADHSGDQEQPSNKRPPSAMSVAVQTAQNMIQEAHDLPSAEAKSAAVRNARDHVISAQYQTIYEDQSRISLYYRS